MTTLRRMQTMVAIPVMACAVLLIALAAPAAAQSEACVHLQVGSGYAATMQINFGSEPLQIGPTGLFFIGQTQCLSLQTVPDGVEYSVTVNAELGDSTICTPSNIPRAAGSPVSVTFNASGTIDFVHCDMPTGGTRGTSTSRQ
jgi:hypothetical protein